jgi:hypothetical protein
MVGIRRARRRGRGGRGRARLAAYWYGSFSSSTLALVFVGSGRRGGLGGTLGVETDGVFPGGFWLAA